MKRSREREEPKAREDAELDEAQAEEEEEELLAEAQAAGLIGARAAGSGVDARDALREAYRSFAQDLPWVERLEVVSADPLGVVSAGDDLKLELALCVRSVQPPQRSCARVPAPPNPPTLPPHPSRTRQLLAVPGGHHGGARRAGAPGRAAPAPRRLPGADAKNG